MSTKMYEAYRFPRGNLDEFILTFNRICFEAVKAEVMGVSLEPKMLAETKRLLFGKNRTIAQTYTDHEVAMIWVLADAILMSKRGCNDLFNLDCSFNLWLRGRSAYIQPIVTKGLDLNKRLPKWCEFYGYWDNTDPQEGVSAAAWEARKKIWEEMALDDWDRMRLSHIVIELKMPFLNGFKTLLTTINMDDEWVGRIYTATTCLFYKIEEAHEAKRAKKRDLGG